ncbi:MAG: hypothetical protein SGJ04_05375 [Bacteroidota bacterium]|nr:hypothetical protein [Bacteroidota bacterium]
MKKASIIFLLLFLGLFVKSASVQAQIQTCTVTITNHADCEYFLAIVYEQCPGGPTTQKAFAAIPLPISGGNNGIPSVININYNCNPNCKYTVEISRSAPIVVPNTGGGGIVGYCQLGPGATFSYTVSGHDITIWNP